MNVHYHPGKANAVAYSLSRMSMGSTSHIEDEKKELVKDVHRLADQMCGLLTLIVDVFQFILVLNILGSLSHKGHHLYPLLKKLKDSLLAKINEPFALGGDVILRYHDRLCVPDVDYLRTKIVTEAYMSKYLIHPGSTKIYYDLQQIYWWDGMKKDIVEFVAKAPNC